MNRLFAVLVVFSVVLTSCITTRNAVFDDIDRGVQAGDYAQMAQRLDGPASETFYSPKDQVLRYLDTGLLYHLAADYTRGNLKLDEAERLIEVNYTKSLKNAAASFLINDYSLDYAGEGYEDLYLNVFKALNFIQLRQVDAAFVEINRLGLKLNLLEDKYANVAASLNEAPDARGAVQAATTELRDSALARFLSLLLYRSEGRFDDAALDLEKLRQAFVLQPSLYDFPGPVLEPMLKPTSRAHLTVVGFSGKSPEKRADTLKLTTSRNYVTVSQERENDQGVLVPVFRTSVALSGVDAGYFFKAQLADMRLTPSRVARIDVLVDERPVGTLQLLEKLDKIAVETFRLSKTPVFYKTVIRTVTKGILAKAAKDKVGRMASNALGGFGGLVGDLGSLATDALVDASEQADLRSARFLPGQAWVGDFELEPGYHRVQLDFKDKNGRLVSRQQYTDREFTVQGLHVLTATVLE